MVSSQIWDFARTKPFGALDEVSLHEIPHTSWLHQRRLLIYQPLAPLTFNLLGAWLVNIRLCPDMFCHGTDMLSSLFALAMCCSSLTGWGSATWWTWPLAAGTSSSHGGPKGRVEAKLTWVSASESWGPSRPSALLLWIPSSIRFKCWASWISWLTTWVSSPSSSSSPGVELSKVSPASTPSSSCVSLSGSGWLESSRT